MIKKREKNEEIGEAEKEGFKRRKGEGVLSTATRTEGKRQRRRAINLSGDRLRPADPLVLILPRSTGEKM